MQQRLDNCVKNILVPIPKTIEVKQGILSLQKRVNLVGEEQADPDALRILKEFLEANEIKANQQLDKSAVTIALSEVDTLDNHLTSVEQQLKLPAAQNLKSEGYVLAVISEKTAFSDVGMIFIKGKDGDGTFYGVKTFLQLINTDLKVPEVVISDEPAMSVRGIVEGFYGKPWSHEDRLDQLKFYGDYKLNTYIYAPKDDPYHREKWREPYPEHEMERMKELIDTAKKNKVDFVFAISPGIDIRFDGEEGEQDFQALLTKSESLYEMGVRSFSILFDDIENKEGDKQAHLLNRFNEEFIKQKKDVKPLITVPTEYDTHAMGEIGNLNPYTKGFSEHLDEDILVMWTGEAVVPESLPLENVRFMQEVYGKNIGIWWNYPVSDYLKTKLALGPIVDIDPRVGNELDFFLLNPMEHPNLSKISLITGADFTWNIKDYDADRSWNRAIELLFNDLAPEMKTFAKHSSRMMASWNIGRHDAEEVRKIMDQFWMNISKRKNADREIQALYEEFKQMVEASNMLKQQLPGAILEECLVNLNKFKLLGENAKIALDMVLAKVNKNEELYNEGKRKLENILPELLKGARVSEKTVLAFIQEALQYSPLPVVSFTAAKTLVVPGEAIQFYNKSSLTTEEMEWIFEGATTEKTTEECPTVVYENEGFYTVKLVGKNHLGTSEMVQEDYIIVTQHASKGTTNLALGKSVTASSFTVETEKPEFAVDGNTRTKWCAVGNEAHTLTVDLGSEQLVSEIVIKHAQAGGEPSGCNTYAYRILISQDGENFSEVVHVNENEQGVTNDPIPPRKTRYVQLIVEKPTQGDDNAARIYEFEVRGLEGDVELPARYQK